MESAQSSGALRRRCLHLIEFDWVDAVPDILPGLYLRRRGPDTERDLDGPGLLIGGENHPSSFTKEIAYGHAAAVGGIAKRRDGVEFQS